MRLYARTLCGSAAGTAGHPACDIRRIIVSQVMSGVRRIYAEKRPGYDVAARQLHSELCEVLGTQAIEHVRIFQRYDVEGVTDAAFDSARAIIFSEPNVDVLYDEALPEMEARLLAVEYLPGQYDQRADSASQCLQLLTPDAPRPKVACAKVYALAGAGIDANLMERVAAHLINPVDGQAGNAGDAGGRPAGCGGCRGLHLHGQHGA